MLSLPCLMKVKPYSDSSLESMPGLVQHEIVQHAIAGRMTALLGSDLSFCRHAMEQTAVLTSLA